MVFQGRLHADWRPHFKASHLSYTSRLNVQCLSKQIEALFGFEMVNNLDWTKDISVIDFLRDYGKYFNVNYMINKETVKRRLDAGISYTEFSYMILQALDFLHLYEDKGCTLQLGGQDQWGNITSAGTSVTFTFEGEQAAIYGTKGSEAGKGRHQSPVSLPQLLLRYLLANPG